MAKVGWIHKCKWRVDNRKNSKTFYSNIFETFQEIMEGIIHIHIIDDNQDSITIAPGEGFQLLGLCHDINLE